MDAYQRLTRGLPARLPSGRSQRTTEKATREAVAGLPLANPAQALREVEALLDGMLATTWAGGERATALAHLHGPVAHLDQGIVSKVGAQSHPLAPASAEAAAAAQRLELKMTWLCAIALHELCAPAGKPPRFKGKLATTTLVAGLAHGQQALMWACRQYQTPPAGLWRTLHALHAFADELGGAGQVVDSPLPGNGSRSARTTYVECLLLALADPQRFSARELRDAQAVVHCVASQCGLQPASVEGVGVDTFADAGPGYVGADRMAAGTGVLAIDVVPAVRVFDERIALLPAGSDAANLVCPGGTTLNTSARFLHHLAAGWATAARAHGRLAASHALDVAVGMRALHYALAGEVDFATFIRRVGSEACAAGQTEISKKWPTSSDSGAPARLRGEVLDQSAGGYRLRLEADACEGARLRIGEIVGLSPVADTPDEREWMVGVVRWLSHAEGGELLGVELLHRSARAAGVRPLTRAGEALVPQRAVELPDAGAAGGLAMLVASAFAGDVADAEVVLPALPSDWKLGAKVGRWRYGGTEAVGAACFRVMLLPDTTEAAP